MFPLSPFFFEKAGFLISQRAAFYQLPPFSSLFCGQGEADFQSLKKYFKKIS